MRGQVCDSHSGIHSQLQPLQEGSTGEQRTLENQTPHPGPAGQTGWEGLDLTAEHHPQEKPSHLLDVHLDLSGAVFVKRLESTWRRKEVGELGCF